MTKVCRIFETDINEDIVFKASTITRYYLNNADALILPALTRLTLTNQRQKTSPWYIYETPVIDHD